MQNKTGCIIIHGFGGNIEEVMPLAQRLTEEGYNVVCPSLKGHTGRRKDLKGVTYLDWIESGELELRKLLETCERIYLIGFSMGGLIALLLAAKYKVAGVVTLNSPIYYWDIKRIMINLWEDLKYKKPENMKHYLQSSRKFPFSAMLYFRVLLSKSKAIMKEVHCPVFIAQALQDDTVRKSSAKYIYEHLAAKLKTVKYYDHSGHLILWSEAAGTVIQDVVKFLNLNKLSEDYI